jgi:uncharacterized protein YggE
MRYHIQLLFVGLVLLVVYNYLRSPLVVTVNGMSRKVVPADTASLTFNVSATEDSAPMAVTAVTNKVAVMKAGLKQAGVTEAEMMETQPQVYPAALVVPGSSGYQANLTVGVKTKQVTSIGPMMTSLYEQGAVLVSQPVFLVEDMSRYENEVLAEALHNAKGKAVEIQRRHLKPVRQVAAITQAETETSGTVTMKTTGEDTLMGNTLTTDNITLVKMVNVSYRMW